MTTPLPPGSVNPGTGTQITTSQPQANGSTGLWAQPPFDPRITTVTWPMLAGGANTTTLQRGFMIWDTTSGSANALGYAAGTAAQVNFLFNPSQVTADYQTTDASVQAKTQLQVAGDPGQAFIPLQQTVQFSLLFDRTYEMWSVGQQALPAPGATSNPTAAIQTIGVDADIRAIRQFTGMTAPNTGAAGVGTTTFTPGGTGAFGATLAPGQPGNLSQGIMQPIRSFVYFGAPGQSISFYGYISEWDVTYTHFNPQMIPIRAAVNITFTLLPPTGQVVTPSTSVFGTGATTGPLPGTGVGGR